MYAFVTCWAPVFFKHFCMLYKSNGFLKNQVNVTGDDTLKLWDMRNFKKPLKVRENLISYYTV